MKPIRDQYADGNQVFGRRARFATAPEVLSERQ